MRRIIAFAVFALLIAGCQGESSPTGTDGAVGFTTVYKAQVSGVATRRGEVISQANRWAEIWSQIGASQPIPSVNLDESLLIFVAGGELSSCSDFKVSSVKRVSGELQIDVVEERRTGCACPAIVARPVHVVSIPRAATGAAFEFRIVNVSGCP